MHLVVALAWSLPFVVRTPLTLTWLGDFLLLCWFQHLYGTLRLQIRGQPVASLVYISHVNPQAAVLTQYNHCRTLLLQWQSNKNMSCFSSEDFSLVTPFYGSGNEIKSLTFINLIKILLKHFPHLKNTIRFSIYLTENLTTSLIRKYLQKKNSSFCFDA